MTAAAQDTTVELRRGRVDDAAPASVQAIVLSDDLAEFVAMTHECRAHDFVPSYDPTGRHVWARRLAQALRLEVIPPTGAANVCSEVAAPQQRVGRTDYVVVSVLRDEEFSAVAWSFAELKEATLTAVANLGDIAAHAAHVDADGCLVVVGHEDDLSFDVVASLTRQHSRLRVGLLCAASATQLSALILKAILYPQYPQAEDECIASVLRGNDVLQSEGLTVYPSGGVDVRRLLRSELRRIVSFVAHGGEDYLRVTKEARFCGRSTDESRIADAAHKGGALPACMHGDGCAFAEDELLDPAELRAQVVFANACLTVKLGRRLLGSGNAFSVGQRFLESWAGALVASPLLKDGTLAENLLFHRLLDRGFDLGSAVRAVNQHLRASGIDSPDVYLFGDPEATFRRAAGPEPSPVDVEVGDDVSLVFPETMPAFGRAVVDDPHLTTAAHRGDLEPRPFPPFGGKTPFYWTAVTEGHRTVIYVLGAVDREIVPAERPRVLRLRGVPVDREVQRVRSATQRFESLPYLDIKLGREKSTLQDVIANLPRLAVGAKAVKSDLTAWLGLERTLERAWMNVQAMDQALLQRLLQLTESRGYHFVEAYRHTHRVEQVEVGSRRCRYCSEVEYRYTSVNLVDPSMRRYLRSCPVCGATEDVDDISLSMWVEGDNSLVVGQATELEACISNTGDVDASLTVGARVTEGLQHGFLFDCPEGPVSVPAGHTTRVPLRVTCEAAKARHVMLLRVYAVAQGRICFAGRDLYFAHRLEAVGERESERHDCR